ncbi:hypothetical protein BU17DRAFT_98980 [Hysterangium stoloniferum]|nr:hypothetical protein BU17DRAFT_98980 [Hysterangium stoloniferum]
MDENTSSHMSPSETINWEMNEEKHKSLSEDGKSTDSIITSTHPTHQQSIGLAEWLVAVRMPGSGLVIRIREYILDRRLASIEKYMNNSLSRWGHRERSKCELKHFNQIYHKLVVISSRACSVKTANRILHLRFLLLKEFIHGTKSILDWPAWLRTEVDMLPFDTHEKHIREMARSIKSAYITKIIEELLTDQFSSNHQVFQTVIAKDNMIEILCRDLAYGAGGHLVQIALERISYTPWGKEKLQQLDLHSSILADGVKRLLTKFNNAYSYGIAFRIFGDISTEKLAGLLSGPLGIGSLITQFSEIVDNAECRYSYELNRGHTHIVEAFCAALMDACCHGFIDGVVGGEIALPLVRLIWAFVQRDIFAASFIEEESGEVINIEKDQMAACRLLLKIFSHEAGQRKLLDAGAQEALGAFDRHSNRVFSGWEMKRLLSSIRREFKLSTSNLLTNGDNSIA